MSAYQLLLRSANSNSLLRCIAALDRDFVYYGEHVSHLRTTRINEPAVRGIG